MNTNKKKYEEGRCLVDPDLERALLRKGFAPHPLLLQCMSMMSCFFPDGCNCGTSVLNRVLETRLHGYKLCLKTTGTKWLESFTTSQDNRHNTVVVYSNQHGKRKQHKITALQTLAAEVFAEHDFVWQQLATKEKAPLVQQSLADAIHFAGDLFFRHRAGEREFNATSMKAWWEAIKPYYHEHQVVRDAIHARFGDRVQPLARPSINRLFGNRGCRAKLLRVTLDVDAGGVVSEWRKVDGKNAGEVALVPQQWYRPGWPVEVMTRFMRQLVTSVIVTMPDESRFAFVTGLHVKNSDTSAMGRAMKSDLGEKHVLQLVSQFAWNKYPEFTFGKRCERDEEKDANADIEPNVTRRRM